MGLDLSFGFGFVFGSGRLGFQVGLAEIWETLPELRLSSKLHHFQRLNCGNEATREMKRIIPLFGPAVAGKWPGNGLEATGPTLENWVNTSGQFQAKPSPKHKYTDLTKINK